MSTSSKLRSSSAGAAPRPRLHRPSRAESAAALALDVRCACQFFQTTSLMPERVNPVGSRPPSSVGSYLPTHFLDNTLSLPQKHDMTCEYFDPIEINLMNEDFRFGPVGHTDYYAESVTSRPSSPGHSEICERTEPLTMTISQNQTYTGFLHSPEKASDQNVFDTPVETDHFIRQKDPNTSIVLKRRSSSRASSDRLIKQRDPSTSSILRKRMNLSRTNVGDNSEDIDPNKQTIDVEQMNSFNDNKITSDERFLRQRDPSQSSILRRKMLSPQQFPPVLPLPNPYYLPSTATACDNNQLSTMNQNNSTTNDFQKSKGGDRKSRLDDMLTRNSKAIQDDPNQNTSRNSNPLALSLVSSRSIRYTQRSVENIPVKFVDSEKSIDKLQSIENLPPTNKRDLSPRTVNKLHEKQPIDTIQLQSPKIIISMRKENLLKVTEPEPEPVLTSMEDVEMMKAPSHEAQRLSIQSFSIKPLTIKRSQESFGANEEQPVASEYIQSKVFENYEFSTKSSWQTGERSTSPVQVQHNTSPINKNVLYDMQDVQEDVKPTLMKQRDPSTSSFTRNRYKTPEPSILLEPTTSNDTKSLPSAGNFPERRASEQCTMIKQKDLSTSTLLNRRRQNLSQTSLQANIDSLPQITPGGKIVKTVSFEFDKQLLSDLYQNKDEHREYAIFSNQNRFEQIEQTFKKR